MRDKGLLADFWVLYTAFVFYSFQNIIRPKKLNSNPPFDLFNSLTSNDFSATYRKI